MSVDHAAPIFDCNSMSTKLNATMHKLFVVGFAVLLCVPSVAGNSPYHQAFGAEEALVC